MNRRFALIAVFLALALVLMAGYLLRLRKRAQMHAEKAAAPVPVTPVKLQPNTSVALADDSTGLITPAVIAAQLPEESTLRARAILDALLRTYARSDSPHPLDRSCAIDAVFLLPDGTAVVDLNDAVSRTHPSGILLEALTLESMVRTLHLNFPSWKSVRFLVAGKPRETLAGHADLTVAYPMTDQTQ